MEKPAIDQALAVVGAAFKFCKHHIRHFLKQRIVAVIYEQFFCHLNQIFARLGLQLCAFCARCFAGSVARDS